MIHYNITISDPERHFIRIHCIVDYIHQDEIHLQLPSWRPGRYELQNFAKNVRCFTIQDSNGQQVPFMKETKDRWKVNTSGIRSIHITYEYFANQLDAGGSFVSNDFMYVNPVNCLLYVDGRMDEECQVELHIPADYQIACQLPVEGNRLSAPNYDRLADSPFIASPTLTHTSFGIASTTVHLWFQGTAPSFMERIKEHTLKYTREQLALFGDIPCPHYHFLYHILPTAFRHGVEHEDSTVIAMGPDTDWDSPRFYDSFMAISSHELFHLWNIKRIRPTEMLPYDFTKENYSHLGYVYEGVTTYYGDMMLLRSGVWSWEQYCTSFKEDIEKHRNNPGRFNYSVAESSFDTWLDGYVPGIPGRKVSIYTEGMLAAVAADILILHHSNGLYSLDNVMHDLYQQFAKHEKGYTELDYRNLLEKYAGTSFQSYFDELIWGKGKFDYWLEKALDLVGCEVNSENSLRQKDVRSVTQKALFEKWTSSRVASNL